MTNPSPLLEYENKEWNDMR